MKVVCLLEFVEASNDIQAPVPCHRIAFAFTIACQPLEASRSAYTTGDPFVYLFLLQVCENSLNLLLPTRMMIFLQMAHIFWVVVSNIFYFHPYLGK